ncbi:MAG: hypothetical protein AAF409_02690 [Pseudomonadota bacterium]
MVFRPFLIAVLAITMATATVAEAKQCVENKFGSGISVKVYWLHEKDIEYSITLDKKYKMSNKGEPFETNTLTAGLSKCVAHQDAYAVIKVNGGKFGKDLALTALGTAIALGTLACLATNAEDGELACAALAEPVSDALEAEGITASAASVTAVAGVVGEAGVVFGFSFINDHDDIFYVDQPSTKHYLDVWGTVFKPHAETGSKKID